MSSDSLPEEVVFDDILTRLPVKSLCRFKCVSKSWLSTISTSKFIDSHFHRSRSNPKLLLSICTNDDSIGHRRDVFITDRQETEQEMKSPLVLRHQATISVKENHITESLTVAGLTLSIGSPDVCVVTNPITKASVVFSRAFPEQDRVAFPRAFPGQDRCHRYVYFGFDPVEGKHKVLESLYDTTVKRMDHRVRVVSGSDAGNWRSIDGPADVHFYSRQQVFIDGVIYYEAMTRTTNGKCIVAFDVRSEKFQVAMVSTNVKCFSSLSFAFYFTYLEFEGKLAIARYPIYHEDDEEASAETVFDLWVMEDFEKQVWSMKFSRLQSFASTRDLIGSTIDDELIFVDRKILDESLILGDVPFTLYLLNIKTGNFWSRDVRLPPEYHFMTARRWISAAPLVERLCI